MTTVTIDPNVRVRGNLTFAGLEDVVGDLVEGGTVRVVEPEAGLVGTGVVTEIDNETRLVYLRVDWASLQFANSLLLNDDVSHWSGVMLSGGAQVHVSFDVALQSGQLGHEFTRHVGAGARTSARRPIHPPALHRVPVS